MSRLLAPLVVVVARVRHRPGDWIWPLLGLAVAVAFAGAVAAQAVVAADSSARDVLGRLSPLERSVRITWQGPVTPSVSRRATRVLRDLGLPRPTTVTLLGAIRLSGVIVRPAAISPLGRWLPGTAAAHLGPCLPQRCPMLLAGGRRAPASLTSPGVQIRVVGSASLVSQVPLAYSPASEGEWPLVITGDPAGLDRVAGLSSVYRTHSWVAELGTARLHSWQLAQEERRLDRAQADLGSSSTQFAMSAPFGGLDAARTVAAAAPRSLLLAGGAAAVAFAMFLVLAAAALRDDQRADLARLRASGATATQLAVFAAGEAVGLSMVALAIGYGAGVAAGAVLAHASGEPAGGVLTHSLLTPAAGPALLAGVVVAAIVILLATHLRSSRGLTTAAVAAVVALVAALTIGRKDAGASAVMLAPLCCVAAGVLLFRATSWLLRPAERLTRRASPTTRFAIVELARAPGLPALAISFFAVAIGLGGFALAYRATLDRGAADQAADRIPLDALVSPTPSFATPLQLASLPRWRGLSHGDVFPVRRTEASYAAGSGSTEIPALGVPAPALARLHGWREHDGGAPLASLARRLVSPGLARRPGPMLPSGARTIILPTHSPQLGVSITADLRGSDGAVRRVGLGTAIGGRRALRGVVPPGRWELEALELEEGTGLAVTNGHQNGESATPATQSTAALKLGPLLLAGAAGRHLATVRLGPWVAVGATESHSAVTPTASIAFHTSGFPGVLRPRQPTDSQPVPVLADRQTASAAGPGGRLGLIVDEQPVQARVVGALARFPTLGGASGFIVADESGLASALDAQLPGQGRPDELWISTHHLAELRRALRAASLAPLGRLFRSDVERRLSHAPIARAVAGTQLAAAATAALLALLGLLLIVQGPFRDLRLEQDLAGQGLGPAALGAHLRRKITLAGMLGVVPGVGIALLLAGLVVSAVGGLGSGHPPQQPLVTVIPALALAAWAAAAAAIVLVTGWAMPRCLLGDRENRSMPTANQGRTDDLLREEWSR